MSWIHYTVLLPHLIGPQLEGIAFSNSQT